MPSRSPSPRTERAMTARCDHGQASAAYRWWRSGPPSGRPRNRLFWRMNSPLRGVVAGTPPRLGVAADEDDDAAERWLETLDGSGGILGHQVLLASSIVIVPSCSTRVEFTHDAGSSSC